MPEIYMNDWPPFSPDDQNRRDATIVAVKLMANAAQTAPNAGGVSQIESSIVYGYREQDQIARKMEEIGNTRYADTLLGRRFLYEAVMVRESDAVLLLGNFRAKDTPMDAKCGACGGRRDCSFVYSRREAPSGIIDHTRRRHDSLIDGPLCGVRCQDFGYAIGSTLWMANRLLVDARAYMTVGTAALELGYLKDSCICVGVLAASLSKNPYVDVNTDYHVINLGRLVDGLRKHYALGRQAGGDYRFSDPGFSAAKARKAKARNTDGDKNQE